MLLQTVHSETSRRTQCMAISRLIQGSYLVDIRTYETEITSDKILQNLLFAHMLAHLHTGY